LQCPLSDIKVVLLGLRQFPNGTGKYAIAKI